MTPAKEEDVCSHVRVVVRVRPENQKEKQGSFSRVVRVIDQHVLVFDPKEEGSMERIEKEHEECFLKHSITVFLDNKPRKKTEKTM